MSNTTPQGNPAKPIDVDSLEDPNFDGALGNGWEDPEVYKDPIEIREKALKMGCNLIYQAFIAQ